MLSKYAKLLGPHKGKQRLVAVALRQGKVVGIGFNSYSKTHPKQRNLARIAGQPNREYLHAEVAALIRSRCVPDTICIVRVNRKGELCNAAPCPVCRLAISLSNPNMKVIHS